jgi:hypothetical protein
MHTTTPAYRRLSPSSLATLFTVAVGICSLDAGESQSFPRIPTPTGFIEASGLSDFLRASGTAGLAPSAKLLGLYHTTNTVADILNSRYAAPAPFCRAVMRREYGSLLDAEKGFRTLVNSAKKESDKKFDTNDKDVRSILKHYEDAARNLVPGVSIKVSEASILGTTLDNDTAFAFCMLVNFAWSDGQSQVDMPFAVAHAYTRLGKRQVDVSVLCPFHDGSSVSTANQKLMEWLSEIRARNKTE